MAFQEVEGDVGRNGRENPTLAIYPDGGGRLNTVASQQWFDAVDTIGIYHDAETHRLGINRNDESAHALTATADGKGISITARRILDAIGASPDDVGSAVHLPLEHDPAEGLIVADLDPLLAEVNDG